MFKFLVTILMVLAITTTVMAIKILPIQPIHNHPNVSYKEKDYKFEYSMRGLVGYYTIDESVSVILSAYVNGDNYINVVRTNTPAHIFAYGIKVDGMELAIIDEDCDGIFETEIALHSNAVVPDCFHPDYKGE